MTCKYSPKCSGCDCIHVPYELQLKNKQRNLSGLLKTEVKVIHGPDLGYRNRMEFIIKGGKIGFREKNKPGTIIDIDECIICKPMINELLREARSFLYKKNLPALRQIVIRSADESSISFVLKESSKTEEMIDQIKEFQTTAENVLITFANEEAYSEDYIVLKGKDKLKASYLGKEFLFPVQ